MTENTKIQWADHTFNPWSGCTKVSPGCKNCYAESQCNRFSTLGSWGPGAERILTSQSNWNKPVAWNRRYESDLSNWMSNLASWSEEKCDWSLVGNPHRAIGSKCNRCQGEFPDQRPIRPKVFSASLADWLDPEVDIRWLGEFLELIRDTPHLDWLLLTKRIELWESRMKEVVRSCKGLLSADIASDWLSDQYPQNVWLGTTVEDQDRADRRIPVILGVPAAKRFLSCEPLLEEVDLSLIQHEGVINIDPLRGHAWVGGHSGDSCPKIDWVICGGESGSNARPMDLDWARKIRDDCVVARVPFFMKQLGGKKDNGGDLASIPQDLRIRELP